MNAQTLGIAGDGDDAFRSQVVGASEVAALFDASPWLTHFELYHRKTGGISTPEFGGNERIEWGVRLEPVIIEAARERYGYQLLDTPKRFDNGKGLGGHPDQMAYCPVRGGLGVLEVKTADWLVAKKWGDEPPLNYLLQNQTYQGLGGVAWGDVIVLVGGNELRRFQYDFRPKLFAEIEARVVAFWQAVRASDAPAPDFARDGEAIRELLGEPTEEFADLRGDNDVDGLAADFLNAKAAAKDADQSAEEAKNRLLFKIGTAGSALLPNHRVGCAMTKGSPDRIAVAGEIIKGRKGYRRFDVREVAA